MADIVTVISVPTKDNKFLLAIINSYGEEYVTLNGQTVKDISILEKETINAINFAWSLLRDSIAKMKDFQNVSLSKQT